jgi:signal transduction histidine kinase
MDTESTPTRSGSEEKTNTENNHARVFITAHAALRQLLTAASQSLGGERLCLISPDHEHGWVVTATTDQDQPSQPQPYKPGERDVHIDIQHGDHVVGRLVVLNPATEVNRTQLQAFASAAGFILGHAHRLEEATRLAEESLFMREFGAQIGESTHIDQLLTSIVRGARRLLNVDYASVATLEPDGTTRWRAMDGFRTDVYRRVVFDPGTGSAGRAIMARRPVALEGIGTSRDLPAEEFPVHTAEGGVSALAAPMMVGGRAIGALILGSRTQRHWTDREIRVASLLANNAAVAIEQVRASTAERAHRVFLEKVIENFPGLLAVLEPPDYRVLLANPNFVKALPEPYRSGAYVIGLPIKELVARWTERHDAILAVLEQVAQTGQPSSFEQHFSEVSGRGATYWNWSAVPIDSVSREGQRAVMLIAHDVTETVQARETATRTAELARTHAEELEAVIRHMADGVVIFDAQGRIKKLNPAAEWLAGRVALYSLEPERYAEPYGLRTLTGEFIPYEGTPAMRALKGETVVGQQALIRRLSGEEIIVGMSASPITDVEGRIVGAVVVFHDITQEKLTERLKDEFLSVVSHELRTPLSAIMGYSDLMLRGVHGAFNERQAKALTAIRTNADRLLRLINDLLDISRLEAGTVSVNLQPVDIGGLVSRVITHTRVLAIKAGVSVKSDLSLYPLPAVMADETKLQQVIENLLTNAIKFTPMGGHVSFSAALSPLPANDPNVMHDRLTEVTPELDLSALNFKPQSLILTVSDTGVGLEEDQLTRIWDRFYQVDSSAKRRSGGAGLGLAIVRSLVELQGGQVWARSQGLNKGSSFSFSLPLSPEPASVHEVGDASPYAYEWRSAVAGGQHSTQQEAVYRHRPTSAIPDTRATGGGTVLVAEDDEDQREVICRMLELEGYNVVLATDGTEALELASRIRPKAIALDIILPNTDGWEVLSRLKSDPATKDIPVLIISVVDQQEFALQMGADEYLVKPIEPATLRRAVRRLIER